MEEFYVLRVSGNCSGPIIFQQFLSSFVPAFLLLSEGYIHSLFLLLFLLRGPFSCIDQPPPSLSPLHYQSSLSRSLVRIETKQSTTCKWHFVSDRDRKYQFFLQVKKDILQGRLPVTTELAAELAALALQSELGDYDPQRYKAGYVSEFRFLAHQSPDLETKIDELHKTMRGLVPAVAEMRYLDRVKWLDLYGVDLHPVLNLSRFFYSCTE
ncbi:hypothetical protein OUZ56_008129 [Daphnia magna]|uniref:FERM domain-containing protein n=1 Tax=Daphnia magna TaxID=35525 RepID=A0ABR0ACG0_9CRUS|nr:hypothetical protein OUZ56_008129 [Daphnia magna]